MFQGIALNSGFGTSSSPLDSKSTKARSAATAKWVRPPEITFLGTGFSFGAASASRSSCRERDQGWWQY